MTDSMTIPQRVLALRSIFAGNHAYRTLEERFGYLLERRRTEIDAGIVAEARSIALIGNSGGGKTTAARHLITSHPGLVLHDPVSSRMDVASLPVPTPATLKFVGQTTLAALGFQLQRDRTAQTIWDMVKDHLQARRTLFLHYDEAQDLAAHQTPKELTSVVNTLKSLMQHPVWPVGLILTGTIELKTIINHDAQLARRVYPVEFPQLDLAFDADRVQRLLHLYADRALLTVAEEVGTPEFAARLIHAGAREFGLLIELVIAALEEAMMGNADALRIQHFTAMFRKRAGCIDGLNPFVAEDFERIESRRLLDQEGDT
ncbi:ATP-binding protein [Paracoccus caeni]|uniref:ATP-binding protein n=1 Tax=Paracoccus caeni TaxID=657651 RepID=A0A934SPJ3_9RHOB|nr:ATP-binding protein [Paracoccus caeni]MBK4218083.1 ATP-binding protein [Paracoccus caeni]